MKFTFLGTGTSQGVPVIGCDCSVCKSKNSKDKRLRSSLLVESENIKLVIDTGPDFRFQMLRNTIKKLDAALITHEHKDHIAGLDDVRAFNFLQKEKFKVYATKQVQKRLKTEFHYAFEKVKYPGVPSIKLYDIDTIPFVIGDINITPILVMHKNLPVTCFKFDDTKFVYITDANYIPENSLEKIKNCNILIINALRKEAHPSHFNLKEAIKMIQIINPNKAYLTHISHLLGKHEEISKILPKNTYLSFDKLTLNL